MFCPGSVESFDAGFGAAGQAVRTAPYHSLSKD
jgi:hypothetical protein